MIISETVAHLFLIMLLKNTSNYIMTAEITFLSKWRGKWFFLLYVPNLFVITSYKRTFLVCLITTFCPCMKSRGFFIPGFVLLSLFLAGWGDRGSCFMTCLTGLPQTRERIALETSWLCSSPVRPSASKQNLGKLVEICLYMEKWLLIKKRGIFIQIKIGKNTLCKKQTNKKQTKHCIFKPTISNYLQLFWLADNNTSYINMYFFSPLTLASLVISSFIKHPLKTRQKGFPGGAVVENLPANAGDTGSSPGLGRSHMPRSN